MNLSAIDKFDYDSKVPFLDQIIRLKIFKGVMPLLDVFLKNPPGIGRKKSSEKNPAQPGNQLATELLKAQIPLIGL